MEQEFHSGMDAVSAECKERVAVCKDLAESVETSIQQFQEDDSFAKELLGQCNAMPSSYSPPLTGVPGASVHLPADRFAEALFRALSVSDRYHSRCYIVRCR